MPAIADLTVKKADGVTDIVYTALKGSGGDNDPAIWRQDTGQPAAFPLGARPQMMFKTQSNGPKSARRGIANFVYPYAVLNSSTGRYEVYDTVRIDFSAVLPTAVPPDVWKEALYQATNLWAAGGTGGLRFPFSTGYAPT